MRVSLRVLGLATAVVAMAAAAPASASPAPSGERILGKTVIEPAYDSMSSGSLRYLLTPMGAPDPVKSNPRAAAPIYLPVYPTGSNVGTLNCQDVPVENCPDHGPAVAGAAAAIMPSVYGNGVIGHDHLMAPPASHGDFNIAWVPTLVLFTQTRFVTHITTEAQIDAMKDAGKVIEVPLDGSHGTPNLTFTCAVVSAAVYARATPWTS
jgi:hypothetical protein